MSGGLIIVQVFDSVLGKEIALQLVDANDAVARFPARYSFVIPNPYGSDNPLPATGLPLTSTLLTFELTVVFDSLLGVQIEMQQIDAIFAVVTFPDRFSWVSGAPVPPSVLKGPELGLANGLDTLGLINGIDELGVLL